MSQQAHPQFEIPIQTETPPKQQGHDILPRPVEMEKQLSHPEQNTPGASQVPGVVGQAIQIPAIMSITDNSSVTAQVTTASGDIKAEDIDVIEKEWVERAKKVLQHTVDDPFLGTRQVSVLKAEYMKKRFNRELNLPEEPGVQG